MKAIKGIAYHLARRLLPLSVVVGFLIAILAPLTYWLLEHHNLHRITNLYAEELAEKFQEFALESPSLWKYQTYKFMALTEGFHPSIDVNEFHILDERGEPIVGYDYKSEKSKRNRHGNRLTFTEDLFVTLGIAPISFNNKKIGTVQIIVSDTRLVKAAGLILCVSSLVGVSLAVLVYRFPVRIVKKAEREILRLNEELESRVEERTRQLVEAQEELVRNEKLAILGQLSGSVGHELRNPLGVMSNAVYYLNSVLSGSDQTVREYLDIIKSEIDNSQCIITDLLDFARVRPPQTKAIAVKKLMDCSLDRCNVPECVAVNAEIPETLPLVEVDPQQMAQVFQNLITNAVQAMAKGGTLRISARRIPDSVVGAGSPCPPEGEGTSPLQSAIEISISDTGEGISPENMKKLFQPLFTTKTKGIGLGLIVCKRLTEANRGTIGVESKPSRGTTFSVALPAVRASEMSSG